MRKKGNEKQTPNEINSLARDDERDRKWTRVKRILLHFFLSASSTWCVNIWRQMKWLHIRGNIPQGMQSGKNIQYLHAMPHLSYFRFVSAFCHYYFVAFLLYFFLCTFLLFFGLCALSSSNGVLCFSCFAMAHIRRWHNRSGQLELLPLCLIMYSMIAIFTHSLSCILK